MYTLQNRFSLGAPSPLHLSIILITELDCKAGEESSTIVSTKPSSEIAMLDEEQAIAPYLRKGKFSWHDIITLPGFVNDYHRALSRYHAAAICSHPTNWKHRIVGPSAFTFSLFSAPHCYERRHHMLDVQAIKTS